MLRRDACGTGDAAFFTTGADRLTNGDRGANCRKFEQFAQKVPLKNPTRRPSYISPERANTSN
jgi:hypothetical protein